MSGIPAALQGGGPFWAPLCPASSPDTATCILPWAGFLFISTGPSAVSKEAFSARVSFVSAHRFVWHLFPSYPTPTLAPCHKASASALERAGPSERFANRASVSLLLCAALGPGSCSGGLEK